MDEDRSGPRTPLRALVVEAGAEVRDELGKALEAAGHEVIVCPGPSGPDYTCVGVLEGVCPLAEAADVVILDTQLESDEMMSGVAGWQLAMFYREQGLPIVALVDQGESASLLREPGVAILHRRPSQRTLLEAVDRVVAEVRGTV